MDPDYTNSQVTPLKSENYSKDDKKSTEIKGIKKIIADECAAEEKLRQKQLEEVELKIYKTQKLLYVLRYALVTTFYDKNSVKQAIEESRSISNHINTLNSQNRIHPAIKKLLLGNDPNSFKILNCKRISKKVISNKCSVKKKSLPDVVKHDIDSVQDRKRNTNIEQLRNQTSLHDTGLVRKKVQHTVTVGNISYFKKSLEQDSSATHKWMVYVKICKGRKNDEEVSNTLIKKVTFYLHPSYKPYDIVEINHAPYHLSRIGWGEFPLRVQVCFKSIQNKPIDIIHQIKLDNTFTERPILGNETTETIFLYENGVNNLITNNSNFMNIDETSGTDTYFDNTSPEYADLYDNTNTNHDRNSLKRGIKEDDTEENKNFIAHDHCYSSFTKNYIDPLKSESKLDIEQPFTELMYGLGTNYLTSRSIRIRRVPTTK